MIAQAPRDAQLPTMWFRQSDFAKLGAMDLPFAVDADDVLAQPTRARLFALIGELRRPAGTVELAERLGLHPNGVRVHLERMQRAGLLERTRPPQGRGRPRDAWAIRADARPGGSPPSAYADLGRWLARAIPAGPGRMRDLERAGREIGRELAPPAGGIGVAEAMQRTLAALGFQPRPHDAGRGEVTFCLGNCPYRDAVRENQQAICTLHRGMTRGLLDIMAPRAKLAGFVPRDPETAGCEIELSGVPEG
jgi:predicted ArsR family transcriptional regulator